METRCERRGQCEVGIITHDGHVFAAYGASVCGRHVTGYTQQRNGHIALTRWDGTTMLGSRCVVVREHHDGSLALVFRLRHGRYVVGYALSEDGMLFRGELLTGCDEDDARREALAISEHWSLIDAEDEADPWHGEPQEPDDGDYPDW